MNQYRNCKTGNDGAKYTVQNSVFIYMHMVIWAQQFPVQRYITSLE